MSHSLDSEVTGLGVIRIEVTTQVFLLTLITPIKTVICAVTEMSAFYTQPVPAPPASFTFGLVMRTVTTGRVRTVQTFFVLRPLTLGETLLVIVAVEGFPPVPGTTAGLVVEVVVVTSVVRSEDSFIISLRTVFLSVTHLQDTDPLPTASTDPIYQNMDIIGLM